MASVQRARPVSCRPLVAAIWAQAVLSSAQIICTGHQECSQKGTSWTNLWYVWVILVTVFLLLMCGIGASCIKFCCRMKRPPHQTFPPQVHDVTVIPLEHDSTAHSTVTSYSSLRYPPSIPLPLAFGDTDRTMGCPPAYSLYAVEMPPSYEDAIQMAKPDIEAPPLSQKQDNSSCDPEATQEPSQTPSLPVLSESSPTGGQETSEDPSVSTQE